MMPIISRAIIQGVTGSAPITPLLLRRPFSFRRGSDGRRVRNSAIARDGARVRCSERPRFNRWSSPGPPHASQSKVLWR